MSIPDAAVLLFVDRSFQDLPALPSSQSLHIVRNDFSRGSGGCLKVGFRYAIDQGFDSAAVILVPGEPLDPLLAALQEHPEADAILGVPASLSFFVRGLNACQNRISALRLRGWHSPCSVYRTSALAQVAFELNTNEDYFQTELLLQLAAQGRRIVDYGLSNDTPLRRSVSLSYAWDAIKACLKFRLQKINLFYDFRYHPESLLSSSAPNLGLPKYEPKLDLDSPHSFVCSEPGIIPPKSNVLDIGCSSGYVARTLARIKGCRVTGVDVLSPEEVQTEDFEYHQMDLETESDRLCALIEKGSFDFILMLDVLEHLAVPEEFLLKLYRIRYAKMPTFIFSTGNVSFWVIRIMLALGYFNYGERGILDITHKRLFSWRTFQNVFDQTGFSVLEKRSFPPPFRLLGFQGTLAGILLKVSRFLTRLRPSLFAYQVLFVVKPFTTPQPQLTTSTRI